MIRMQKPLPPKISVIIPAHNGENYIESCIKSVKSQSFKNYEIIVVDNGSNDNTSKIARKIVSNVKPGSIIVLHNGLNLDYRANR